MMRELAKEPVQLEAAVHRAAAPAGAAAAEASGSDSDSSGASSPDVRGTAGQGSVFQRLQQTAIQAEQQQGSAPARATDPESVLRRVPPQEQWRQTRAVPGLPEGATKPWILPVPHPVIPVLRGSRNRPPLTALDRIPPVITEPAMRELGVNRAVQCQDGAQFASDELAEVAARAFQNVALGAREARHASVGNAVVLELTIQGPEQPSDSLLAPFGRRRGYSNMSPAKKREVLTAKAKRVQDCCQVVPPAVSELCSMIFGHRWVLHEFNAEPAVGEYHFAAACHLCGAMTQWDHVLGDLVHVPIGHPDFPQFQHVRSRTELVPSRGSQSAQI